MEFEWNHSFVLLRAPKETDSDMIKLKTKIILNVFTIDINPPIPMLREIMSCFSNFNNPIMISISDLKIVINQMYVANMAHYNIWGITLDMVNGQWAYNVRGTLKGFQVV